MDFQLYTRLQELASPNDPKYRHEEWELHASRTISGLEKILEMYQTITLDGMKSVSLLDRTDTKFVCPFDALLQALSNLTDQYRVLRIDTRRIHSYHNLYFDTPQLDAFIQHHRQQRDRYKVRCRAYDDTHRTFLEIKRKNNRDRTTKSRLETSTVVEELPGNFLQFLNDHYPKDPFNLNPVLWNDFKRITLVSKSAIERLTLDINMRFSDGWNRIGLPNVAVAEVKQELFTIHSDFMTQMRTLGIQPRRFSKYCLGIPIFYPQVKANRFKPRDLLIQRIIKKGDQNGRLQ